MDEQIMVNKEKRLPSFLRKLLNMANDPETNSLISWGSSGTSIIIWDHIKFSTDLLPKHFKHSNFSSFVYQLNNYGFSKIGYNSYEYKNPCFQLGKEYLIANMTRRTSKPRTVAPRSYQGTEASCSNTSNNNLLEVTVEALRSEIKESAIEIEELKRQQAEIELQMVEFQNIQAKYEKIVNFLAIECDETVVVEASKKRKRSSPESSMELENEIIDHAGFDNLEGNVNGGHQNDDNFEHVNLFENHHLYWTQMLEQSFLKNGEPVSQMIEQNDITAELEVVDANLTNEDDMISF